MSSVIIVSNRLPVAVKKTNGTLEFSQSVGGLSNALSTYAMESSNKWIGWPGLPSDDLTEADMKTISRKLRAYNCYPVFLTKKQIDLFYNGYSNSILWPLFHNQPTKFDHYDAYWKAYREINALYTDAILALSTRRNNVWVHDYQLLLVPALLRAERPHDNIGLFMHIPFPDAKSFGKIKHAKQLLVGMLGADVVGFHTSGYTTNFLDAVQDQDVGVITEKNVLIEDHVARIAEFPIGIDYAKSIELSGSVAVEREARAHRRKYGKMKVILTVDRLDPTKGFIERLQAYRTFLLQNPQLYGKVVMVMLATPSRTDIAAYKALRKKVDSMVAEINETFGVAGWLPVDIKYESLPYERVVALYKIADVAFITPLRDGMNLVAKEYVAAKQNKNGVLILSETAGAAEELTNAILVNPKRRSAMVDALDKALSMPQIELKRRLKTMQVQLSKNSVQKWASTFMTSLQRPSQNKLYPTRTVSSAVRQFILDNYHQAEKRQIFLDYDGTLSPFIDDPAKSAPSKALYELIKKLTGIAGNELVVVSGRSRENLESWFGDLPVTMAAEHGSYLKKSNGKWAKRHHTTPGWKKSIRKMMEIYAERTPGAFVEEKENSLVWHYRKSPSYHAQKNMVILKQLLNKSLRGTDLKVHSGHKILEVKPKTANKGVAASELLANHTDFILSIGDDYTDEDMFASLPAYAFTLKVGPGRTNARYRIKNVEEVIALLKKLI